MIARIETYNNTYETYNNTYRVMQGCVAAFVLRVKIAACCNQQLAHLVKALSKMHALYYALYVCLIRTPCMYAHLEQALSKMYMHVAHQ